MSKSNQVRELLKANPEMKTKEITEKVGCNSALVYQIKAALNKGTEVKVAAKRGRPAKEVKPTDGQIILRRVMSDEGETIRKLNDEIKGYRTVISYLEHQLGLKDSQRGAAI